MTYSVRCLVSINGMVVQHHLLVCWTCNREVVHLISGWVTIRWLLFGLLTITVDR